MKTVLNKLPFLMISFVAVVAQGQQSSMELSCRAKAKEIAAQTYSSCVTEARNTQIDQIRKDYQKQLADLKAKYDKELKKIGGKGLTGAATSKETSANIPTSPGGSTPKATKGIAKTLPTRKEVKSAAPVIQEVREERSVNIPASTSPGVESESIENDANGDLSIELVPAPTTPDKTAASSSEGSVY